MLSFLLASGTSRADDGLDQHPLSCAEVRRGCLLPVFGVCPAAPEQHIVSCTFASFVITQLLTCSAEPSVDAQLPRHAPVFCFDGDLMEGALVFTLDG